MGPQHTRCGKSGAGSHVAAGLVRFNGAATYSLRKASTRCRRRKSQAVLQWGRNILVAESSTHHTESHTEVCFNGAATYSLRKDYPKIWDSVCEAMLQWGRNILVAESRMGGLADAFPWGGFNGAATYSLRKVMGLHLIIGKYVHASMGPQHTRCGKLNACKSQLQTANGFNGAATYSLRKAWNTTGPTTIRIIPLQWGRNILVAESP